MVVVDERGEFFGVLGVFFFFLGGRVVFFFKEHEMIFQCRSRGSVSMRVGIYLGRNLLF